MPESAEALLSRSVPPPYKTQLTQAAKLHTRNGLSSETRQQASFMNSVPLENGSFVSQTDAHNGRKQLFFGFYVSVPQARVSNGIQMSHPEDDARNGGVRWPDFSVAYQKE
jgi:hypothetical protein